MYQLAPTSSEISISRNQFFWAYFSVIAVFIGGYIWNVRPSLSPNDNARWDTVWSLVEFGTYQIFDTKEEAAKYHKPRQLETIDKAKVGDHFIATKPPLMSTVIAGFVKVLRPIVGRPFDVLAVKEDLHSASYQVYCKLVIYAFVYLPFLLFLWLYRHFLDQFALDNFTWTFCLLAAGLGTFVTGYSITLNNHTIAACFAFFTGFLLIRMVYFEVRDSWMFFACGVCSAWAASNELPAGLFVAMTGVALLRIDFKRTMIWFLPPVVAITVAFFVTNYLAVGNLIPAYLQPETKDYPGSYWNDFEKKSLIDSLNDTPENPLVYFVHMTIGHHGLFSLTPILIFVVMGFVRYFQKEEGLLPGLHWPILFLTAVVFVFYWLITTEHNYGGFCHGMRWLLWLIPFWLMILPAGVQIAAETARGRKWAWIALLVSIFSVADTLYNPWTYSWLHRILNWLYIVRY